MAYRTFDILVTIDGEVKQFNGIGAVDLKAALADISDAFSGEVLLVQYKVL